MQQTFKQILTLKSETTNTPFIVMVARGIEDALHTLAAKMPSGVTLVVSSVLSSDRYPSVSFRLRDQHPQQMRRYVELMQRPIASVEEAQSTTVAFYDGGSGLVGPRDAAYDTNDVATIANDIFMYLMEQLMSEQTRQNMYSHRPFAPASFPQNPIAGFGTPYFGRPRWTPVPRPQFGWPIPHHSGPMVKPEPFNPGAPSGFQPIDPAGRVPSTMPGEEETLSNTKAMRDGLASAGLARKQQPAPTGAVKGTMPKTVVKPVLAKRPIKQAKATKI